MTVRLGPFIFYFYKRILKNETKDSLFVYNMLQKLENENIKKYRLQLVTEMQK